MPTDYQGERRAGELINALTGAITSKYVSTIGGTTKKSGSYEDFIGDRDMARVILVSDKVETPHIYKSLSVQFKKRLMFAEVKVVTHLNTRKQRRAF